MDDEKENPKQGEQQEKSATDLYLEELEKLKQSTVKKEDFDKIKEERDKLIKAAAERTFNPDEEEEDDEIKAEKEAKAAQKRKERIKELGAEIRNTDGSISNLDFIKKSLELRKLVLEDTKGQNDIFVNPYAEHLSDESYEHAKRTADVLEQCVKLSNGDPRLFTTVLQTRIKDDNIPMGQVNLYNKRRA